MRFYLFFFYEILPFFFFLRDPPQIYLLIIQLVKTITEPPLFTKEAGIFIILIEYLSVSQYLNSINEVEGHN